jgi:hypothetical protein
MAKKRAGIRTGYSRTRMNALGPLHRAAIARVASVPKSKHGFPATSVPGAGLEKPKDKG